MPFCKYCGSEHDADAVFAQSAGSPLEKSMLMKQKRLNNC